MHGQHSPLFSHSLFNFGRTLRVLCVPFVEVGCVFIGEAAVIHFMGFGVCACVCVCVYVCFMERCFSQLSERKRGSLNAAHETREERDERGTQTPRG